MVMAADLDYNILAHQQGECRRVRTHLRRAAEGRRQHARPSGRPAGASGPGQGRLGPGACWRRKSPSSRNSATRSAPVPPTRSASAPYATSKGSGWAATSSSWTSASGCAARAELAHAQDALRQSQKARSGRPAQGGVAHDFNNLLTIIRSSVDFLRRPDLPEARKRRYLDAVSDTWGRAAKLTGQLPLLRAASGAQAEVFSAGKGDGGRRHARHADGCAGAGADRGAEHELPRPGGCEPVRDRPGQHGGQRAAMRWTGEGP